MQIKEVTMLTKDEFYRYQNIIPKIEEPYWLKDAPTDDGDHIGVALDKGGYADDVPVWNYAVAKVNIRPVIKYQPEPGEEPFAIGSKQTIGQYTYTAISSNTMICDSGVMHSAMMTPEQVDTDEPYCYETSEGRQQLLQWAESQGITQTNISYIQLKRQFEQQMDDAYRYLRKFPELQTPSDSKVSELKDDFEFLMNERNHYGDLEYLDDGEGRYQVVDFLAGAIENYMNWIDALDETPWDLNAKDFVNQVRDLEEKTGLSFQELVQQEAYGRALQPDTNLARAMAALKKQNDFQVLIQPGNILSVTPKHQPSDCTWKMEIRETEEGLQGRIAINGFWITDAEQLKQDHDKIHTAARNIMAAAREEQVIEHKEGWVL